MTKRIDLNAPENWLKWLKACAADKSPHSPYAAKRVPLGAITGTDARVLQAIAALWNLCHTGNPPDAGELHHAALDSIALLLPHMQRSCWPFARELAAQQLNWEDRALLWPLVTPETHP